MKVAEFQQLVVDAKAQGLCPACDLPVDDHRDEGPRCWCCNLRCPTAWADDDPRAN